MKTKPQEVVTPLSICHGCFIQKTLWEGKFTPVNMKHCTRCNVRKHKEIKNGSKYINLYISLKFGSMDKIKIKYSEHKRMFGKSEKGLITSLGLKTNV